MGCKGSEVRVFSPRLFYPNLLTISTLKVKIFLFSHEYSLLIVEKQRLLTERWLEVPDYFATVREDNNEVLGMVGKDYTIVQNRDVFTFFDQIVGQGNAIYEIVQALEGRLQY